MNPLQNIFPTESADNQPTVPVEHAGERTFPGEFKLDPLFLAPEFEGTLTDTPVGIDEDCNDCD